MIADLYRPGDTMLHRMPAATKLAAVAAIGTGLFLLPMPELAVAACVVAMIVSVGLLGWRFVARVLRAALPVVLVVAGLQLWFAGVPSAVLFGARLAALLVIGALLTATTRPSDIADAVERWSAPISRPLRIDPARVGLAVALTIRFVPVLASIAGEIREAQAARGLDRSIIALAVPLVVRTLRMADEIAEAIDARS